MVRKRLWAPGRKAALANVREGRNGPLHVWLGRTSRPDLTLGRTTAQTDLTPHLEHRTILRRKRMSMSSKLEPIMKVEVVTPDVYVADVIVDLKGRLGEVERTDQRDNAQVIHALVPQANMVGYVLALRSITQGQANCTIQYDH
jgi:hypothetical protein